MGLNLNIPKTEQQNTVSPQDPAPVPENGAPELEKRTAKGIDDIMREMAEQKNPRNAGQNFYKTPQQPEPEPEPEPELETEPEPEAEQFDERKLRRSAERNVKTLDWIISFISEIIAGLEYDTVSALNQKQHFLQLVDEWMDFIEENPGWQLPPWAGLALSYVSIYGINIKEARKHKKKWQQQQKREDDIARGLKPETEPRPADIPETFVTCDNHIDCPNPNQYFKPWSKKNKHNYCSNHCKGKHQQWLRKQERKQE